MITNRCNKHEMDLPTAVGSASAARAALHRARQKRCNSRKLLCTLQLVIAAPCYPPYGTQSSTGAVMLANYQCALWSKWHTVLKLWALIDYPKCGCMEAVIQSGADTKTRHTQLLVYSAAIQRIHDFTLQRVSLRVGTNTLAVEAATDPVARYGCRQQSPN